MYIYRERNNKTKMNQLVNDDEKKVMKYFFETKIISKSDLDREENLINYLLKNN